MLARAVSCPKFSLLTKHIVCDLGRNDARDARMCRPHKLTQNVQRMKGTAATAAAE
jgi:hypothetical protein